MNLRKRIDLILIGASTGGPRALNIVLNSLPKNLGVPILVVQHMPTGMTKDFAERLNENSNLTIVEAKESQNILKDIVYVAPGGYHMEIGTGKKIRLNKDASIWGVRPAVDKLFMSAPRYYSGNILSIILTGMGKDGAAGTVCVKEAGGVTVAQDEKTSTIYGMPKMAFETGKVDKVLPLEKIPSAILSYLGIKKGE